MNKILNYTLVFICLLVCCSENVFAIDLSGNLEQFNSNYSTNSVSSTDSTKISINISNYYVSVMEPYGDGTQLEQFSYKTNPFYTSNISYSRWLPRRIGFDGNTSSSFNLSYLYTLSYRFNYPSSTDYFDWRTYMNYSRPKIYGSTSDLFSCSIIANTSSYSDIKCTFKRSNADNYFFFYFDFFDTPNALNYYGIPGGFGPELSFSNISLAYSLSADDIQVEQNDIIINQNNQTNQKLDNLNDSLNDSNTSDATNEASDFFSGFETDTFGLTSIITAPLNLIGSITSSTCSPLALEVPFISKNSTLRLPCMTSIYQQYFGSFLSVYQTITFGVIAYWVCVRIFALVKDFKNPDHDEIEVLDL